MHARLGARVGEVGGVGLRGVRGEGSGSVPTSTYPKIQGRYREGTGKVQGRYGERARARCRPLTAGAHSSADLADLAEIGPGLGELGELGEVGEIGPKNPSSSASSAGWNTARRWSPAKKS